MFGLWARDIYALLCKNSCTEKAGGLNQHGLRERTPNNTPTTRQQQCDINLEHKVAEAGWLDLSKEFFCIEVLTDWKKILRNMK
jgi:hypothetical protein